MCWPRTARTGLSDSLPEWSAIATDQLCPKSEDFATTVSFLSFCSHAAYTVLWSVRSTTICASNSPDSGGAISRGACQVTPLSALTTRIIEGIAQETHPG